MLSSLLTVSLGNVLAFLLVDSLTNLLVNVMALLLGHLAALLLGLLSALLVGDVTTLLDVVNLLTHLACHMLADRSIDSLAFLGVGSGALLGGNILKVIIRISEELGIQLSVASHLALVLGNLVALLFVDNTAMLGGNILADLVLNSLALPLGDYLALDLGPSGALLLHDRGAIRLIPGGAMVVVLSGALLLMDGLLDSSGDGDALPLGDVVALLLVLLATMLLDVIGMVAILLVFPHALLPGNRVLEGLLSDMTLALLDIGADGVVFIVALPPDYHIVDGLGHVLAHLLRNLAAHGLGRLLVRVGGGRVGLEGDFAEDQKNDGEDKSFHC